MTPRRTWRGSPHILHAIGAGIVRSMNGDFTIYQLRQQIISVPRNDEDEHKILPLRNSKADINWPVSASTQRGSIRCWRSLPLLTIRAAGHSRSLEFAGMHLYSSSLVWATRHPHLRQKRHATECIVCRPASIANTAQQ